MFSLLRKQLKMNMLAMKIINHGKSRTKNHNLLPRLGSNHQLRVKATSRLSKNTDYREGNKPDARHYWCSVGVKGGRLFEP